jgi:hypothetical protein
MAEAEGFGKNNLIRQLETEIAMLDVQFEFYQNTANTIGMYKQKLLGDLMILKRDGK